MSGNPMSAEREAEIREDLVSMCDADVVRELLAAVDYWRAEFREAMDNYHGEHAQVVKLRAERDSCVEAIAQVRETCAHLYTDRDEETNPYRVGQDKMADLILDQLDEHYRQLLVATGSWVPCSPEWLAAHPNQCDTAPRAPGYGSVSHLHPVIPDGDEADGT